MSIATVDNSYLIHYEVLGRGRPLIFLHGWLGSWRYWWPSMQALSTGQRTFAFDLWGFGDSSKDPTMYSLPAYVEMVEQFIDKLGIARSATLVGHSLGAAVALRYAGKHPDRVHKVVAVSMPINGRLVHERLTNTDPDTFINRVLGKSNSFSEVDAEIRKTDQSAMNQQPRELSQTELLQDIQTCPRPLLLVSGVQDPVVTMPPNGHDQLQDPDRNRFFVPLDECSHFPMLQEKAKFNRLVLDFIHADDSLTELTPKEYWQRRVR